MLCEQCRMAQTAYKVPAERLAAENLYLSAAGATVTEHDRRFASEMPRALSLAPEAVIVEIGCSDGSLLREFQRQGYGNVLGIDASPHASMDYPFPIMTEFFTAATVEELKSIGKRPDLIVLNYVIELVPDIRELFDNLSRLMKDGAFLVIEVPYLCDFLETFRLDGFAHLRCNWFTVTSLAHAFKACGLDVVAIEHDRAHRGGTLRAIATKRAETAANPAIDRWIEGEARKLTTETFRRFREHVERHRKHATAAIRKLIADGVVLYAYGAGLKASTLVNWLGLTSQDIRWAVDHDPAKQGRMIPIANIPIRAVTDLVGGRNVGVLVLALDHQEEVEHFLQHHLASGSVIVHALPEFKAVTIP